MTNQRLRGGGTNDLLICTQLLSDRAGVCINPGALYYGVPINAKLSRIYYTQLLVKEEKLIYWELGLSP